MKLRQVFASLAGLTQNPNALFYAALVAFVIDNVVNYFVNVPIFVVFALVIIPLMWLNLFYSRKGPLFLLIFSGVFLVAFIVSNIAYSLNKSSISDLLFILLFATSYYYYLKHKHQLKPFPVKVFLVATLAMLGFGVVGFHSTSIDTKRGDYLDLELVGISFDSLKAQAIPFDEFAANFDEDANVDSLLRSRLKKYFPNRPEIDTMQMFGIRLQPGINFANKKKSEVKMTREFRQGLFRIPHVAAYFLGVLLFYYLANHRQQRKLVLLLFVFALVVVMLWTGVRTFFIAMGLSLAFYLIFRKSLWYLVLFSILLLFLVIFRYYIFAEFQNTLLEPFAMLLIRMVDTPEQISRVVLIRSWWMEVQQFGVMDFLTGKTLYQSQLANLSNLFNPVWYHNDFLSVFYAYGLPALVVYVLLFINIYRFSITAAQNKTLVAVFFYTILAMAFINGFYYYFPVLLLYVFILITQNFDKAK